MAQVRITDSAGVERDTIPLVTLEKQQRLGKITLARITVNRDDLNGINNLTPGRDRVFVEDPAGTDTFGGVLRSPGRSGGRPQLVVPSFAEYMRRAKPVPSGQKKTGVNDNTLIQECIDATPQLTAGTLANLLSGETWIFSGITQLAKARKVAEVAGGELTFNPDLTVDYADSRGADKTSTTLSPSAGSFVENTFNVERDGVGGAKTHLKVYGVGQGTAQVEATVVPADDTASYTNKVTYTNDDWAAGDDEIWGRRTNKDIKNVSALQAWGQSVIEELQDEEVRVQTVAKGATVNLGDEFHINHSDEGVNKDLRAVEVTKLIGANGGTRYDAVFSNYAVALRDNKDEQAKDTGRYRQAFEGDLVQLEKGPGRGPVDSTHDYVIPVFYPDDVVAEVRAELTVSGLNYRAFAKGAAAVPNASFNGLNTADGITTGASTPVTLDTYSIGANETGWPYFFIGTVYAGDTADYTNVELAVSVQGEAANLEELVPGIGGSNANSITGFNGVAVVTRDLTGETIEFSLAWQPFSQNSQDWAWAWQIVAIPPHTHNPDPGLLDWDGTDQSPAHYPENIQVVTPNTPGGIDLGTSGTFQSGADDGTQAFEATLDLSGELSQGWNQITLESDGLGHLDASFSADLFRQSL